MYKLPDTKSKKSGINSLYWSFFTLLSLFKSYLIYSQLCVEKLRGSYAPKTLLRWQLQQFVICNFYQDGQFQYSFKK